MSTDLSFLLSSKFLRLAVEHILEAPSRPSRIQGLGNTRQPHLGTFEGQILSNIGVGVSQHESPIMPPEAPSRH